MRRCIRKFLLNFSRLFTAFSFYRLRGADMFYFQFLYPTILAGLVWLGYSCLAGSYMVVRLDSFVASATTLMGVLIGFYIAALAAVTSFPNDSLDNEMAGDPVELRGKKSKKAQPLTRRRFLSTLLGYCAFLSIFIYVLGSISAAVDLMPTVPCWLQRAARCLWWTSYTWLLASLFVVTMLCLHYLIERMHRE